MINISCCFKTNMFFGELPPANSRDPAFLSALPFLPKVIATLVRINDPLLAFRNLGSV